MSDDEPRTVTVYGRVVELPPLPPGDVVEDVVLVARTRGPGGTGHRYATSRDNDRDEGEPLDGDMQYLVDLGVDRSWAALRAGHRRD